MNIQPNKLLISCCFTSLLLLTGCGLKGDLYQTKAQDSVNKTTEPVVTDKASLEEVTPKIEQEFK
tara:strand:- start:270 stop:464 length:195 start_codon:yes stop_codon:yes gene_type:complete